jgi:hypothetical protein
VVGKPLGPVNEASYAASSSLPPPTLGLWHRLHPTAEIAVALSGGCSFYSCITLTAGLLEEELSVAVYLVGAPEDELWLQLQLSLVSGRNRPCAFRTLSVPALPMLAEVPVPGAALTTIVYNTSGGGHLSHQVPVLGVA